MKYILKRKECYRFPCDNCHRCIVLAAVVAAIWKLLYSRSLFILTLQFFSLVCQAKSSGTRRLSRQYGAVRWWSVRLVKAIYYGAVSDNTVGVVEERNHSHQISLECTLRSWIDILTSENRTQSNPRSSVYAISLSRKHDLREKNERKFMGLIS